MNRIVELPTELSPNGKLAACPLVSRDDSILVGFTLWMFDGYSPDGEPPPESYRLVATGARFAQHGYLVGDYPATTFCADDDVGAVVLLDEPDNLVEFNLNAGESGELLAFINDEIMVVIGAELVASGTWRLLLARSSFGTTRADHNDRDEVWLIRRDSLVTVQSRAFIPATALQFKVIRSGKYEEELGDADAIDFTFTGSGLALPCQNLRVNGRSRDASYAAASDVLLTWSPPYNRTDVSLLGLKHRTFVEILKSSDNSRLWTKKTNGNNMKILAAKMTAILGAETEFILRVSTDVLGDDYHLNSTTTTLLAKQI